MAVIKKLATASSLYLATIALLFNSQRVDVKAAMQTVSNGVVRIELEKHFIPHQEIEELEEGEENDQIRIEIDNSSYVQLRDKQNAHIKKSFSKLEQKEPVNLVQQKEESSENMNIDSESVTEVDQSTGADEAA